MNILFQRQIQKFKKEKMVKTKSKETKLFTRKTYNSRLRVKIGYKMSSLREWEYLFYYYYVFVSLQLLLEY